MYGSWHMCADTETEKLAHREIGRQIDSSQYSASSRRWINYNRHINVGIKGSTAAPSANPD